MASHIPTLVQVSTVATGIVVWSSGIPIVPPSSTHHRGISHTVFSKSYRFKMVTAEWMSSIAFHSHRSTPPSLQYILHYYDMLLFQPQPSFLGYNYHCYLSERRVSFGQNGKELPLASSLLTSTYTILNPQWSLSYSHYLSLFKTQSRASWMFCF